MLGKINFRRCGDLNLCNDIGKSHPQMPLVTIFRIIDLKSSAITQGRQDNSVFFFHVLIMSPPSIRISSFCQSPKNYQIEILRFGNN